jgi:hypothetical protein
MILLLMGENRLEGCMLAEHLARSLSHVVTSSNQLLGARGEKQKSVSIGAPDGVFSRDKCLDDHLELLRCYYNFARPHRALKFGREVRTPALQAGLTDRPLTLREIFSLRIFLRSLKNAIFLLFVSARPLTFTLRGLAIMAWQQLMTEAPPTSKLSVMPLLPPVPPSRPRCRDVSKWLLPAAITS